MTSKLSSNARLHVGAIKSGIRRGLVAQSYQVDIVTKVSGYQDVQKLEKALAALANDQNKVDQAARKAAGSRQSLAKRAGRAGSSAEGASTGALSHGTGFAVATAKITAIVTPSNFHGRNECWFSRQQAEQRLRTSRVARASISIIQPLQLRLPSSAKQTERQKRWGCLFTLVWCWLWPERSHHDLRRFQRCCP